MVRYRQPTQGPELWPQMQVGSLREIAHRTPAFSRIYFCIHVLAARAAVYDCVCSAASEDESTAVATTMVATSTAVQPSPNSGRSPPLCAPLAGLFACVVVMLSKVSTRRAFKSASSCSRCCSAVDWSRDNQRRPMR